MEETMQDPSQEHPHHNGGSSSSSLEQFSQLVPQLLMGVEELRQAQQQSSSVSSSSSSSSHSSLDDLLGFVAHLHQFMPGLDQLSRHVADLGDPPSPEDAVQVDMYHHVHTKIQQTAQQTLQLMMQFPEHLLEEQAATELEQQQGNLDEEERLQALQRDFQGAVASATELNLCLLAHPHFQSNNNNNNNNNSMLDEIVNSYVAFQRQTLRTRVKPTIAQLIQERKRGFNTQSISSSSTAPAAVLEVQVYDEENDEHDNNKDKEPTSSVPTTSRYEKHHANALATILGQTAALLHPLLAWKVHLPPPPTSPKHDINVASCSPVDPVPRALFDMCHQSIVVLNDQAQQLVQTVSDWFWEDRPVQTYLQQSALESSHNDNNNLNNHHSPDLGTLDGLVEEMSLACLLLAQYQSLIASSDLWVDPSGKPQNEAQQSQQEKDEKQNSTNLIETQLLREWSWNYASLERYLAVQQWHRALALAQPIQIVIHSQIYVPSVVEDAQYLSTRALERAAATQALQAIGTVAHAIAHDVWSTDVLAGSSIGVFQALMEEKGCWMEPESDEKDEQQQQDSERNLEKKKQQNTFASALLDALDDDMGGAPPPRSGSSGGGVTSPPRSSGKPPSGNFLSALSLSSGAGSVNMRLMQMHAKFCALNGIHAAAGACRSLVEYLDGLIAQDNGEEEAKEERSAADAKAMSMIQLAREELFRYARTYDTTQQQKIQELVAEYATVLSSSSTDNKNHNKEEEEEEEEEEYAFFLNDSHNGLYLDYIGSFIAHENYNINAATLQKLESDDRLEHQLMGPLKAYIFLQQVALRSEFQVLLHLVEHLVSCVVERILKTLWWSHRHDNKSMSDWGCLLLSKQVRLIQNHLQECLTPQQENNDASNELSSQLLLVMGKKWERLTQVVAILQMEQPAEWLMYRNTRSVLTETEVAQTMKLRIDFSEDAIAAVCSTHETSS